MLLSYLNENEIEAGCDEAGRGCIAGPVYAAAVILPRDFYHPLLNDSKKLNEQQRNLLRPIIEKKAHAYSVAMIDHKEIDKINILQASLKAMHIALDGLSQHPTYLLIDGNRFKPYKNIPHSCIIKGDGKYASIAAASILAKTYRDEYMYKLAKKFTMYHWQQNKGYPTSAHREAVKKYSLSTYHRKTFACLPKQLNLDFD